MNSIIGYNTSILLQSGLSDLYAHWGYVIFTIMNFLFTIIGLTLVDRKGRKFLLVLGTIGIIVSMCTIAVLFLRIEAHNVDVRDTVQTMVEPDQTLAMHFNATEAKQLLLAAGYAGSDIRSDRASLDVIYAYGDFTCSTNFVRSDDVALLRSRADREGCVPVNKVEAFFKNPFADFNGAQTAPLKIERAVIGTVPESGHGWLVAIGLYCFMAFYALGPGVCVWLALSELMPTRIRSNGMSIALVINQVVSTTLAAIFLPVVSKLVIRQCSFFSPDLRSSI